MMMSIKEAKANARVLQTFMEEQGATLAYGQYLEAVARLARHKNWATFLAAANEVESLVKTLDDVANWPTYVFFFDENEETDYDEALFVRPPGSTLDDDDSSDGLLLPGDFVLSDKIVATAVYSRVPAVDKYGLPDFANEEKAATYFRGDLKCGAIDALDVSFTDGRDDSAARMWFEARVHPDVAQVLDAFFAESAPADTAPIASVPMTDAERTEAAYSSAFADVFEDVAGRSVDAVMECLSQGVKAGDIAASSWLKMKLGSTIEMNEDYRYFNCRQLMGELRKKAGPVYDDLLLRALGH